MPRPDTMNLLMQDQRTTWGTLPPAMPFRVEARIVLTAQNVAPPADIASFEEMSAPAANYLPAMEAEAVPRLILSGDEFPSTTVARLTGPVDPQQRWTSRDVSRDGMIQMARPRWRRTPLSGMLVIRIDGEESSPPLSFGGGVGSVLNLLPRQQ